MRLYQNCDELPKWNFDQVTKTKDLRWLICGYEYGEAEVPEAAAEVWENIMDEYGRLAKSNTTIKYFELIDQIRELSDRLFAGEVLVDRYMKRVGMMDKETRKAYAQELRELRFYLNESKPFKDEYERLKKQLKAVRTILEAKTKEAKAIEEKNTTEGATTIQIKVKIQKLLKVNLDLKAISVTEWLQWIEEATQTKAA